MAGRFEKLRLLHWSASDLQAVFGMTDDEAVAQLVRRGSYPGAFPLRDDAARWRVYVRDSIIEPAIGRDILLMEPVRKPALSPDWRSTGSGCSGAGPGRRRSWC